MNKKSVKLAGLMLCMLILIPLIPAVSTQQQNTTKPTDPKEGEPQAMFPRAMVMGRLSNVHKIGRFVIAHAVRLHYLGISIDRDLDRGTISNHLVIFRELSRFHMVPFSSNNVMVFGNVQRLRLL